MSRHEAEAGPYRDTSPRVIHHREVTACLEWLRDRLRNVRLLEGACLAIIVALGLLLGLFIADHIFHLRQESRLVLLIGALVLLGATVAWGLLLRPFRTVGDEECAWFLEHRRPELENYLANTVSFDRSHHRERRRGLEAAVLHLVEDQAVRRIRGGSRRGVIRLRRAAQLGIAAGVVLLLVAAYAVTFPAHFRNALSRFARPLAHVPPITQTTLRVRPGDAVLQLGESLTILAEVGGRLPERAVVFLEHGASPRMEFDGRAFSYTVERPAEDFTYRVVAGDAESDLFQVEVRRPPEVKQIDVTIRPPVYTGWPERVEKQSTGNLAALKGSEIVIEVTTTLPVREGSLFLREAENLPLESLAADRLRVAVTLEEDREYDFFFVGEDGTASPERELTRKLTALPDHPPACEIVQPGRDVAWDLSAELPVLLRLADDVGLREAALEVSVAPAAKAEPSGEGPLASWVEVTRLDAFAGKKEAVPSVLLDLQGALARAVEAAADSPETGAGLLYRARAVDLLGQATHSRSYRVRPREGRELAEQERRELERIHSGLTEVLRRERELHGSTREVLETATTGRGDVGDRPGTLAGEQDAIQELCLGVLTDWARQWVTGDARTARLLVARAARELMPQVSRDLSECAVAARPRRGELLELALRGERRIISILSRALGLLDATLGGVEEKRPDTDGETPPRSRGVEERLEKLLADLEEFVREQNEVIARTRELEGIAPEDFTAEEKDELEKLAAIEEKWGKYLEEKGTDLSKVAPQDMSLGTVLEEVVEMVEEIDLAKNYLEGKNIELAVPTEQAGAALAEEIETNIERWLHRDRDRLKWTMEESPTEFDVPLADLPSELEDIVGELIDQEELMSSETEDITSSWLDSMDEGIGWDAMDGPISNMSAKGVTGNLQPNDMEIGGRSGEGRSGKSQGQFVEETATGKGGRQTPTRSTPDPFESGEVKDTGKDPTGGSTGGGKLSGAGEQGLRGKPSPELDRRMGALAAKQTRLRNQTEKLNVALRRRRYYPQNLDRAIDLMRKMEKELAARRPYRYETLRRRIVTELRSTERLVASHVDHRLQETLESPAVLDEDLLNAGGEEVPEEYRELIRDYYRSLAAPPKKSETKPPGSPAEQ